MRFTYKSIPDEATPLNEEKKGNGEDEESPPPCSSFQALTRSTSSTIKTSTRAMAFLGAWCGMLVFLGVSPQSMMALVSSWGGRNLQGANTIKICAKEMILITPQPSIGADVKCWDKDPNGDDEMCNDKTGDDGCVTMTYENKGWDTIGGMGNRNPDIYCSVTKHGFVESVPADKDHHNQSLQADFGTVTLYRDRTSDYGHDNGCGPAFLEKFGINAVGSVVTTFGEQCFQHDKCYWDCQIFNAYETNKAENAQKFCDEEMLQGMLSNCYSNRGGLTTGGGSGEENCLYLANEWVYWSLQTFAADYAYDRTEEICRPEAKDSSLENDYNHLGSCEIRASKCGYDGTFSDDLERCNNCCKTGDGKAADIRTDSSGSLVHDKYCGCFPTGVQCGTTGMFGSYNKCNECCWGSKSTGGTSYCE